jgi:hypothetical protein
MEGPSPLFWNSVNVPVLIPQELLQVPSSATNAFHPLLAEDQTCHHRIVLEVRIEKAS